MPIILNVIAFSLFLAAIINKQPNLFWTAGLFAILALIIWIYSLIIDAMPEPEVKHEKTFTLEKIR